jgi:hypothetical protein
VDQPRQAQDTRPEFRYTKRVRHLATWNSHLQIELQVQQVDVVGHAAVGQLARARVVVPTTSGVVTPGHGEWLTGAQRAEYVGTTASDLGSRKGKGMEP